MTRDEVVMGMTEEALREYRRTDLHSDEAKMLTAIRAALRYLDDEADLSVMKRYVEGEWSRQELSAMRYDLALAD
jgi:hypothetical protein